jgi:hypothetical protein
MNADVRLVSDVVDAATILRRRIAMLATLADI